MVGLCTCGVHEAPLKCDSWYYIVQCVHLHGRLANLLSCLNPQILKEKNSRWVWITPAPRSQTIPASQSLSPACFPSRWPWILMLLWQMRMTTWYCMDLAVISTLRYSYHLQEWRKVPGQNQSTIRREKTNYVERCTNSSESEHKGWGFAAGAVERNRAGGTEPDIGARGSRDEY